MSSHPSHPRRPSSAQLTDAVAQGNVAALQRLLTRDRVITHSWPLLTAIKKRRWACAAVLLDAIEPAEGSAVGGSHVIVMKDAFMQAANDYETYAAFEYWQRGQLHPMWDDDGLEPIDLEMSREDGTQLGQVVMRMLRVISAAEHRFWHDWVLVRGLTDRLALPSAAAALGHVDLLAQLLRVAPDAGRLEGHDGTLPIHFACFAGHSEIIRRLHAHDAECLTLATDSGMLPIHYAAQEPSGAAVKLVMELAPQTLGAPAPYGHTALTLAAWAGSLASVRAIHAAAPGMVRAPIMDGQERAIFAALRGHNLDIVDLVLQHGPPEQLGPTPLGRTPLHEAARRFPQAVAPLLRAGPQYAATPDEDFRLPLHELADSWVSEVTTTPETVHLLVQAYPEAVLQRCGGYVASYPIHLAASHRRFVHIAEALLEAMSTLQPHAAFVFDSQMKLPLDLAVEQASMLRRNGAHDFIDDRMVVLLASQRLPSKTALLHHMEPLLEAPDDMRPLVRHVVAAHLPERDGWRWDHWCWDQLQHHSVPGLLPLAGCIWEVASDRAMEEHLPRLMTCLTSNERDTLRAVLRGLHRCRGRASSRSGSGGHVPGLPVDPLFRIMALAFPMT